MCHKDYLYLLALLCAIPGAWLSFRKSIIRDFQDQMVNVNNPGGVGTSTVVWAYRFLAYVMIGPKTKWLELFDPVAKEKLLKTDETSALRIFIWFALMFIFSFLRWLSNEGQA